MKRLRMTRAEKGKLAFLMNRLRSFDYKKIFRQL